MPTVNVNINPVILSWALNQTKAEKLDALFLENIKQWLAGTKLPTFNQIEDFSKKSNIPLGYFFLQTPPVEQIKLLEYRTLDSIQLATPSRDLIDIIHEMEDVQEWMIEYKKEMGFDLVSYVGCMKNDTDKDVIVNRIREDLGIGKEWNEKCKDISSAFNELRSRLEDCGILVMMSGIVGKNTHRALDLDEFRAFAMVNECAPLIFINGADSWGGRLFSLCHEMAHIWLGENDLYNDRRNTCDGIKPIEVICNAVAGELLVPQTAFITKWSQNEEEDIYKKIEELAKDFLCSGSVIARKALDNKMIRPEVYDQVVSNAIKAFTQLKQEQGTGGNYYSTAKSRLDGVFVRALCESVNTGRTSFTEAYRLTNTTSKTFSEVVSGMGGVLW